VLDLGKISVGPPYFDSVFAPLMAPLVFLLGVGTVVRWGTDAAPALWRQLRWSAAVALLVAVLGPVVQGRWSLGAAGGLLMAAWIVASSLQAVWQRAQGNEDRGVIGALLRQPASFYGMTIAHLGLAVFIVGVTMVKQYEIERDVNLGLGESAVLGDYRFRLDRVGAATGPNYDAQVATISVIHDDRVTTLQAEKRLYRVQQTPITVAAIDTGVTRDLFVALGEAVGPDGAPTAFTLRLHVKPFVSWIWGGCLLMALGGALAVFDRRYLAVRAARRAPAAPMPVAEAL
jgi:cytochrome c-type biogenesis protein CcmF